MEVTEIKKLDEELEAKIEEAFSYDEVVRAVKCMKKGKGIDIEKISSEMFFFLLRVGGNTVA